MRFAALLTLVAAVSAAGEVSALHPRIYVRADQSRVGKGITVSELRARWKDPAYARFRIPVATRGAAAAAERAARYLEEGRADDLSAVRDFLATHTYSYEKNDVGGFLAAAEMAMAYDWIHAGLSAAERPAILANIVTTAASSERFLLRGGPDINHNYTYMALNAVAVCGLVLKGEPEPYDAAAQRYLELARRFIEGPGMVLDTWNAREAAWGEGSHYTFHETLRTLVLTLHAYRSATDSDYFPLIRARHGDFVRKAGRFLIASTRPDMTFERIGDTSANRVQAALTVPLTVEMLAAGVEDGQESARLRSFTLALLESYGEQAVRPEFGWGMRIFFDPRRPARPSYQTLPLFQRHGAETYEHIMWRNGWGPDSTLITILAGDHYTDHQHFDKGQFLIYRRGGLAVDSGAYDRMYQPDRHANEYAPRTLAHNCLLVYDPQQAMPKGYTNDGGQLVIRGKQHHSNWPLFVAHAAAEGLDTAQVLASGMDEKNGFAWLRADLRGAYGERVEQYERQFAYLPGAGFLLVLDTVTSARAEFQKRWLLHLQEEPLVDGQAPGAGIRAFPGAQLVSVRNQGAMFVRTLLPADHVLTTIGGPGYEYYNAFTGRNYPVSNPNVAAGARESGRWRIEVAPAQAARSDRFLHAIEIREGVAASATEARLVAASGGAAGAHLLTAGRNRVVLFASGAALPLRYEINSGAAAGHFITGLPPRQAVVVRVNNRPRRTRADANGVLRFDDRAAEPRSIAIDGR